MASSAAGEQEAPVLPLAVPWAHALLVVWSLAPLAVAVNTNVNVIFTAVLTVFIGCRRSVKPTPPADSMSRQVGPYLHRRCRIRGAPCAPVAASEFPRQQLVVLQDFYTFMAGCKLDQLQAGPAVSVAHGHCYASRDGRSFACQPSWRAAAVRQFSEGK